MSDMLPDSDLPDSAHLRGLCTRCGDHATFAAIHEYVVAFRDFVLEGNEPIPGERVVVLSCDKCDGKIVVIEKFGRRTYPESTRDERAEIAEDNSVTAKPQRAEAYWWGVQWWPRPD